MHYFVSFTNSERGMHCNARLSKYHFVLLGLKTDVDDNSGLVVPELTLVVPKTTDPIPNKNRGFK